MPEQIFTYVLSQMSTSFFKEQNPFWRHTWKQSTIYTGQVGLHFLVDEAWDLLPFAWVSGFSFIRFIFLFSLLFPRVLTPAGKIGPAGRNFYDFNAKPSLESCYFFNYILLHIEIELTKNYNNINEPYQFITWIELMHLAG